MLAKPPHTMTATNSLKMNTLYKSIHPSTFKTSLLSILWKSPCTCHSKTLHIPSDLLWPSKHLRKPTLNKIRSLLKTNKYSVNLCFKEVYKNCQITCQISLKQLLWSFIVTINKIVQLNRMNLPWQIEAHIKTTDVFLSVSRTESYAMNFNARGGN